MAAFFKIRIPPEEISAKDSKVGTYLLDKTRIHPENYSLAYKIASDLCHNNQNGEDFSKQNALRDIIAHPGKLK